jgi:predicted PolB exonuclease-like 3'-5' exonuclease
LNDTIQRHRLGYRTVPDLERLRGRQRIDRKVQRRAGHGDGEKFPKLSFHSIVCIGALVAHLQDDHWEVSALGAPNIGERSEREIISAFVNRIAELAPQLVTFNGASFDLPVLRYRAMVCGVPAPGLAARPYFNR